jgi:ABC-2 type transport system permease protein
VLGYSQDQMITYIFLSAFLQSFILATALNGLSGRVYSGEISGLLLKPVNLYAYLASEDIADKLRNILFIIIESGILYAMYTPLIPLPSALHAGLFVLAALMGAVMNFIINLLFGSIGFWSPDTWGPKFMFFILVEFTAGKLFPLDVLPEAIRNILYFTPFPFFSFFQTQIFLGRLEMSEILTQLGILATWIVGLYLLNKKIWNEGIKDYAAAGQ